MYVYKNKYIRYKIKNKQIGGVDPPPYPNQEKIEGPLKEIKNQIILFYEKRLLCCSEDLNNANTSILNDKQKQFLDIVRDYLNVYKGRISQSIERENAKNYKELKNDPFQFNNENEAFDFFVQNMTPLINLIIINMYEFFEEITKNITNYWLPFYRIYTSRELDYPSCDYIKDPKCCDKTVTHDSYQNLIFQDLLRIILPIYEFYKIETSSKELGRYVDIIGLYKEHFNENIRELQNHTNEKFCIIKNPRLKRYEYGSTIMYIGKDDKEYSTKLVESFKKDPIYYQTSFVLKDNKECGKIFTQVQTPQ
jgi:hypothetical protein